MKLVNLLLVACVIGFVRGFAVVVLVVPRQPSSVVRWTPTHKRTTTSSCCTSLAAINDDNNNDLTVHSFLRNRRQAVAATALAVAAWFLSPPAAVTAAAAATDTAEPASPEMIRAAFSNVQNQVSEGISYMQTCIDQQDYAALLEFTQKYDQILRKGAMGKAKKLLADKQSKELATVYANSVTFDLIGINKSSRPGQENMQTANKYLQELRDDVNKFLELEPKFSSW